MEMSFRLQGEFITNLAREKAFYEGKVDYAIQLLTECMQSDQLSDREIRQMAYEILDGRAELKGTYPDDDYGFRYLEEKSEKWNFAKMIEDKFCTTDDIKKKYQELETQFNFICENLDFQTKRELNDRYKEDCDGKLFKDCEVSTGSAMLDSYIKRQMLDTDDDYGWLEPNGTFHAVEWGEHQSWADHYLEKVLPEDEYEEIMLFSAGDYLVDRGWVLLHNPTNGIAYITKSELKELTNQQKNFLYQYYIDRDCVKEANAVYAD